MQSNTSNETKSEAIKYLTKESNKDTNLLIINLIKNKQKLEYELVNCQECFNLTTDLKIKLQVALQDSTIAMNYDDHINAFFKFKNKHNNVLQIINCDIATIYDIPDFISSFIKKIENSYLPYLYCENHLKNIKLINFKKQKIEELKMYI